MSAKAPLGVAPVEEGAGTPGQQAVLGQMVEDAAVWCAVHGLVVGDRANQRSGTVPGVGLVHAPFSLLLARFPASFFNQACELAPIFNELVDRVSLDGEFLQAALSRQVLNSIHWILLVPITKQVDEFTSRLLEIHDKMMSINKKEGPEITASQLKNWLNNRKAKLARIAKERAENADKPSTPHPGESSESAGEDNYLPPAGVMTALSKGGSLLSRDSTEQMLQAELSPNTTMMVRPFTRSFSLEPGRLVSLVDSDGKEVGRGMIFQAPGKCPTESCVCVVDVVDLRTEKWRELPHPSEAFGWTFQEAEARNGGIIRVSWDAVRLFPVA
ncbi:Nodulin homeobox [Zea mays]|uniref:Nodulin homeobox n=1 Tax=Zea mays TaxID=4577 RepID=A0A1D6F7W3_MAIZE|nr:Nodulin homeobox [Zea mays]